METGGTRVYPGTHRDARLSPQFEGGTIKYEEKPQTRGTAIVFDGLLQHHGTANVTNAAKVALKTLEALEKVEKEETQNMQDTQEKQEKQGSETKKSSTNSSESDEMVITPRDRYFYYMAICIGQDANTEVTGYGGKEKGRSKEERQQAVQDAQSATKDVQVVVDEKASMSDPDVIAQEIMAHVLEQTEDIVMTDANANVCD